VKRIRTLAIVAAAAVPLAFVYVQGPQLRAASETVQSQAVPFSFNQLVENKVSAVVLIATSREAAETPQSELPPSLERFFERFGEGTPQPQDPQVPQEPEAEPDPTEALGSGFVIDPEGYIVTNNHVIDQATDIRVTLADGQELEAKLVGADAQSDLALVKVETDKPLAYLEWGDSDTARVGDWVIAIGSPFGLGGTVTAGIVSARARDIQAGLYADFIQTDASINRGNSGGPLISMDGTVIGVNSAIFSPIGVNIGIGFAVPTSTAQPIIEQLRDGGTVERGWLGVQIQVIDEQLASAFGLAGTEGALVSSVVEGSPAATAGIQVGDVIVEFAGQKIKDVRALQLIVAGAQIGQAVDMVVQRGGERIELEPVIALLEPEDQRVAEQEPEPEAKPEPEQSEGPSLGFGLSELTPEERSALGIEPDAGVVVSEVLPDSIAAGVGLQAGDIILRIDGKAVSSAQQAADSITQAQQADRNSVALLLRRGERQQFVAMPLRQIG
jgi:serine protease Do